VVSRRSNKLQVTGGGSTGTTPRHAGCLIGRHPFFFEARDTMIGTYLMALFAMLFAASSALTLIHFISRLDTPAPEVPEESPKIETVAA
jgi:hypothetical protein